MKNKFKEGEEVFARENPSQKLIIRLYKNRVYYCQIKEEPTKKEKVYFENELSLS